MTVSPTCTTNPNLDTGIYVNSRVSEVISEAGEVVTETSYVSEDSGESMTAVSKVFSPILEATSTISMRHWMQSLALPSHVVASVFRAPFRIAIKGKRRGTWSTEMEVAVSAFRSACRYAPRDLSLLRAWTDIGVPPILLPKGAICRTSRLHGMKTEWVYPESFTESFSTESVRVWSSTHPIVLYIHGGGFCLCGSNTHRNIVCSFAMENLVLFVPNYRRPPDVDLTEAVNDCAAAYTYLVTTIGIDPHRISIMGDSAGGALAVLLLQKLESPPVSSLVLISPWCDLADPEIHAAAAAGTVMPEFDYLPLDAMVMISDIVMGSHSKNDPKINPMYSSASNFPKTLIHVGQLEVLFNQIVRFYDKLIDNGVDVKMTIWTDMVHVPHAFTHVSETARIAVVEAAKFVKNSLFIQSGVGMS